MDQVKKVKKELSIQFWCPLSGVRFGNEVVAPHRIMVFECWNGAIFAKCAKHDMRCFIADRETVKFIIAHSQVVRIVENKVRKGALSGSA